MAKTTASTISQKKSFENIVLALTKLAIFRGARKDKTLLATYAKRLDLENADDVCAALGKLEEIPRKEGELAMPDIGTILGLVDSERRTRIAQLNTQAEERLVRWRCPDCGVTMCGFLRSDAPTLRYCRGIPRKSHYAPGEVCGQVLEVVSNAPARVASGR